MTFWNFEHLDILIQTAAGTPWFTVGSDYRSSRHLNGSGRRCYFQIISMGPRMIEELQIGVWRQVLDRPKSIEINNVLYCRLAGRVDKIV